MNLVSLCLKIPNLGILIFYLIFIVILPYILVLNGNTQILKYYLPMLVAFANLLSKVGNRKIFENLYDLQPDNFVSFLSSNFINLFALFGILWQCLEYSKTSNGTINKAVIYGVVLFIIAFPFARNGLTFVLDHIDFYLREKTDLTYRHNWHLLVFGLLFIIFLLGIQAVLLNLVDSTDSLQKNSTLSSSSSSNRRQLPSFQKIALSKRSNNNSSNKKLGKGPNSFNSNNFNDSINSSSNVPRFENIVTNKNQVDMLTDTVENSVRNSDSPVNLKQLNKVKNHLNSKSIKTISNIARKMKK